MLSMFIIGGSQKIMIPALVPVVIALTAIVIYDSWITVSFNYD